MKIGIFSDVHGNFVALQTVLAELEQEQVDRLLCLGDICALGPQPAEVIERLRQLQCPVILGNTDAWLEDPLLARESEAERHRIFYELALWSAEQLSESDHAFIRSLPSTLHVPLPQENSLLCFHGSPRSFDDVIAAVTPDDEVARMLQGQTATVMAGGHTHIQMVRRYQDSWILNCGAVGLPGVNAGSPELPQNQNVCWAEYAILRVEQGRISLELRRTPLDGRQLVQALERSSMPHKAWWLQKWRID